MHGMKWNWFILMHLTHIDIALLEISFDANAITFLKNGWSLHWTVTLGLHIVDLVIVT